jgi:adenosine deaminase
MDFKALPKIENHLHLEGAIPLDTLWELIQKYGGDESVSDYAHLKHKFEYRDFNHFIETWSWKNQFLREYEDFVLITESVLNDLASQNIKYAEIFVSPSLFKKTLETQKLIEAVSAGISRIKGIGIRLIIDLVRDYGPENEMITLHEINDVKDLGIIGIGLGGTELSYPPSLFSDVFEKAREFEFHTTSHAGEAAGSDSIWGAIRDLKVDRIGHGTRAIEDEKLLEHLSVNKIPVETCPISNLRTRVIDSIIQHPVITFKDMGIPFSINTDDPKMFGNSLAEEYLALQTTFDLSSEDIANIIIDSIQTTWLSQKEKEDLILQFREELENI